MEIEEGRPEVQQEWELSHSSDDNVAWPEKLVNNVDLLNSALEVGIKKANVLKSR